MTGLAAIGLLAGACTAGQEAAPERDESLPPAPTVSSSQGGTSATGLPEWEARSGLSIPRDDFATATVGEEIWVFGGMTGDRGNRLDSIEVYDTRTERWRMSQRTVPEGLASFEGASIGDRVFIFGGLDANSDASDFSAVFDTSTGDWRRLPPLPRARYAHTVTLHDGLIYVIGGEAASGPVEHVDIYDPAANKWTSGAAMPQARGSHDAVSAGEAIYVLGGWLDSGPSDLVQTYLPGRDTWAAAPRLPEPVSRAGATVLDGRLWVSLHEFSYVLDLADEKWSPANPLTLPRHGLGYVAVGGSIYGIGGCSESPLRDVRTVDVLDVR
ncbi:MAG: hypothetical protein AVDCRST_MAG21-1183 [uncultured Nocardioidaceae bacterium]|uniref:Galactose oxidase n=1 Tax=uncultured Nocardioidaceae bacterium TaxID=253824 RepID=A0A6J4MYN3_9ACTN|nr:MAG: hypothetical protein AVDCRST_MAG21-1183 [uncultured Nocardioidaceae bacterium]